MLELEEHILDRLGKLPEDLKKTYDEIYGAMTKYEKIIADRAFQWVMCTCTPLNTETLLAAIWQDEKSSALKPLGGLNKDLVLKYCRHLLVIDPVSGYWTPSHLSVIEYFEDYLWSQSQANYLVTSVCLLLLQNAVLWNRQEDWDRLNFYAKYYPSQDENGQKDPLDGQGFESLASYAMNYWPIHAHRITETNKKNEISTRLEEFLGLPTDSSRAYQCWHKFILHRKRYLPENSFFSRNRSPDILLPTSVASFTYCVCGLATILPTWHDLAWIKDDIKTETGQTFLELAVISGSIPTCRLLIKHGAEVNSQTKSSAGSALVAAAVLGQKEVVELLLKEGGAEVDMQVQYGWFGSALIAATYWGQGEIVEFLVKEGGAEVNMQVQYGKCGSALVAAAYGGQRKIVEFLVREGGAEVNMQVQYGSCGSALVAAAYGGQRKIVEFLVEEGRADVNLQLQYGEYGSALFAAAYWGWGEIVEFLVKDRGAEVNMEVQYGRYGSALVAAVAGREKEIVEFLLKEGVVDVNLQLQHGKYATALEAAEERGESDIEQLLINYGAKIGESRGMVKR
jgi:ankyrin repeat protein